MADFPRNIRIHMDSRDLTLDEALVSRSRAGRIRVRRLYQSPKKEFHIALRGLTDTERDSVMAFLVANRSVPFNLFWPYGAGVLQVVWTDSHVEWQDVGAHLSNTDLVFAVAT